MQTWSNFGVYTGRKLAYIISILYLWHLSIFGIEKHPYTSVTLLYPRSNYNLLQHN